jgi:transcriptional regulator with PAS, ATPase and Fis domain
LFTQADRGTLFLDEIGELPLHMQTKLLHVIEDKEVRPIGGDLARKVNTRIIAATNRNLVEMVKEGRFREDLYFRISMFQIHIPPLRERKEDIARLIHFVLQGLAGGLGKHALEVDPVAEEILINFPWPGNVRELENVMNRAHILADSDRISLADLPLDIARSAPISEKNGTNIAIGGSLRDQLRKVEADIILRALQDAAGDRRVASQKLDIGLSSLYRKLEEIEAMGSGLLDG